GGCATSLGGKERVAGIRTDAEGTPPLPLQEREQEVAASAAPGGSRGLGHHPVPEALHAVEERARLRRMPARALADEGGLELLQQLALLRGQVDRRLDHGLAVQVTGAAAAHGLDAFVAQAEHLAGL